MGKFFNGKVKKDRTTLIKYGAIAGGILLIIILIIIIAASKNKKDAVLELKDTIDVEINGKMPEVKDYFNKFENFDEDKVEIEEYSNTALGSFEITITAEDIGSENITVNIVDTTAPTLVLKDVIVPSGSTYSIENFIEKCEDNSEGECIAEFYTESVDQNGNPIDYSSYTKDDKYLIKIIAKDESGNITKPQDIYLTIGRDVEVDLTNCLYGGLTVNEELYDYPMAVIVGDQNSGCAINRDLWDSKNVQNPVNYVYTQDNNKLKKDLESILQEEYPNGAKIVAYPHYIAILNEEVTGLVGYAIYVNVYIADANTTEKVDSDENLMVAYYLNSDMTREYDINKFNLAK